MEFLHQGCDFINQSNNAYLIARAEAAEAELALVRDTLTARTAALDRVTTNGAEVIEYDAPHRTQTQILADDLQQAMRNLRRDWPHMIRPGDTQSPGWASRNGAGLDDHSFEGVLARTGAPDHDMRRIDRTISLRTYTVGLLNSWARLIVEDRGVTHHLPDGRDPLGMSEFIERHADWVSGHEAAQECRDELVDIAHRCHLVAFPTKRESMSLGACPLEIPGDLDVLKVCGGDVRARTADEHHVDGKVWAACNRCGEVSPAEWWAERMFLDGEGSPLVTIGELVAVIAYRLEVVVTHDQIRQWKHRGKIESAGTDAKGRTLYRHEEVIDAIRATARAQGGRVGTDTPNGID